MPSRDLARRLDRRLNRLATALAQSRDEDARERVLAGSFWCSPAPQGHLASVLALPIRRRS